MVCSAVCLCVQLLLLCHGAVDTTQGWSGMVGVRGPKAQPLILKFCLDRGGWGGGGGGVLALESGAEAYGCATIGKSRGFAVDDLV